MKSYLSNKCIKIRIFHVKFGYFTLYVCWSRAVFGCIRDESGNIRRFMSNSNVGDLPGGRWSLIIYSGLRADIENNTKIYRIVGLSPVQSQWQILSHNMYILVSLQILKWKTPFEIILKIAKFGSLFKAVWPFFHETCVLRILDV